MAVASGVLIQIFLVVFFRREEISQRFHDHREFLPCLFLFPPVHCLDHQKLSVLRVKDPCPVLDADIVPLPVESNWIDHQKIIFQQLFKIYTVFIIVDPDRFRMSAPGADIPVGRLCSRAVCISCFRMNNAVKLVKKLLKAPETSARKINGLHAYFLSLHCQLILPNFMHVYFY